MSERILLSFDESPIATLGWIAALRPNLPLWPATDTTTPAATIARRGWEDRAGAEYVGVMIVRRFHGLLVDLNAPHDLQDLALRMMVEESEHTRLCLAAAASLGSDGELSFELSALQQPRSSEPLDLQLLEMCAATYGVGEVVAMHLITYCLRALPPSPYRDVLQRIASDEARHARIGATLLRHLRDDRPGWLRWPGDAWLVEVVRAAVAALRDRDWVEADELVYAAGAGADVGSVALLAALADYGVAPADGFVVAAQSAVTDGLPRAFGDLIDADGWRRIFTR